MPKLKKRADGRYQLKFLFEGKNYVVYGYSRQELEEKKVLKIQKLQESAENHANPTLLSYYKYFTDFRRNKVKESTLRNQDNWFRKCADVTLPDSKKRLGEMRMKDIMPKDIKYVQSVLAKSGLSSSSVNDYLAHLAHVFNSAVKDEILDRNPCRCLENIKRTETPARETKHRALTAEETKKFFEAATDSFYLNHYKMMLQTGIRLGELGALTIKDIDFEKNYIQIRKTVTRSEVGAYLIGDTPKTDSSNRDIPLTETVKQIIRNQQKIIKKAFGLQFQQPLFPTAAGELLRDYPINRDLKRILDRTDIEKFTCHAFRATFATRWIEQRPQDYKILSEILGHASTKITLDLYTHVMKENKETAMNDIVISM